MTTAEVPAVVANEQSDAAAVASAMRAAAVALEALKEEPWERKEAATHLLLRIVRNIADYPQVDKYRILNEFNPKLSNQLFSVAGCLQFLYAIGFEHTRGAKVALVYARFKGQLSECGLVGNATALSILRQAREKLEQFAKNEAYQQQRKERDERIAVERAADSKPSLKHKGSILISTSPCNVSNSTAVITNGEPIPSQKSFITVWLQSLLMSIAVEVPVRENVSFLRRHAAGLKNCQPEQVRLVLVSSGSLLHHAWDHLMLTDCGITDESVVLFNISEADEIQETGTQLQSLTSLRHSSVDSWILTRSCLEVATRKGLPAETAKAFKRSLHSGQMTLKEIRVALTQELQTLTGEESPLEDVEQYFMPARVRVSSLVSQIQRDREYSQTISQHNAIGLKCAAMGT
jgi:hypothetical protein